MNIISIGPPGPVPQCAASSYEKKPSKSGASTSPPAAIAMGSSTANGSATTNGHNGGLAPIPNNHGFGSSYGAYGNTV